MDNKKQRAKAKEILQSAIAIAYYKLEDENLSEEDEKAVMQYINQYGKAACKAFGMEYVTY